MFELKGGYEIKPIFDKPIYISKPLLPPLKEYIKRLELIWEQEWLTNHGMQHQTFEKRLAQYLRVPYVSLFDNGTTALMVAHQTLKLKGKVITTPFTFPATPYSLSWMGLEPIFCDIDPSTMNIDVNKIQPLITKDTSAILAVHVFGVPCDVHKIDSLAQHYNLKVIYDAAHAFGVEIKGRPIGTFGDISMMSLHATKLFHTAEGGALLFNNEEFKIRADLLKSFGIEREDVVSDIGINGKMNELQAALGLTVLEHVEEERKKRRALTHLYRQFLYGLDGIELMKDLDGIKFNYQYFTIRIHAETFGKSRDYVHQKLREHNVFARRYFYPLCSKYPLYRLGWKEDMFPAAQLISEQTLTLPLYGKLTPEDIEKICTIISDIKKNTN